MSKHISVEFLGPIQKDTIQLQAENLQELSLLLKEDALIAKWLDKSAIAVNDKLIKDINHSLNDNDKISILPPVCGG